MRETKKEYWDKYWQKANLLYNEKIVKIILKYIDIKNKKILEVGAGSGATSLFLASLGAKVYALDYSFNALKLIEKNNIKNVPLIKICGDAFNLPFKNNTFDLVFSQGLIEHYKNPIEIIMEKKRVTKKNGFILIDVPQKYNLYTVKKHILIYLNKWFAGWETEFSITELEKLFKLANLKIVKKYAHSHFHNLYRIQNRLFNKKILPDFISEIYNKFWQFYEEMPLSLYTLWAIGILGQKN